MAIAAQIIAPRMMAGRAAQGEGGAIAAAHRIERGEHALRAPIGRRPGVGGERGRGIEAEPARKRVDPIECERSAPDERPDIADQNARPPGGLPARGTGFPETDIGHVVQRWDSSLTPARWLLPWPQPVHDRTSATAGFTPERV